MNSENINNTSANSDEISLKELILKIRGWSKYLLSKWLVIFVFGIFGGILGYIYAYSKKPVYSASTTFVLEEGNPGSNTLGSLGGLASMVGVDIGGASGGGIFQGDNILELYKSRTMIEKTLLTEVELNGKKQLLVERFIDFNNFRMAWDKVPELRNMDFSGASDRNNVRLRDSILGKVVADINKNYLTVVKLDKKLSIIKAEVKANDEIFAKLFNEQIVKNVNDFYVQTKTKKSLETVTILQQKVDSVRAVMNGAIYSAAIASDITPNLNPTRQVQRSAPMQRSQFSAETNKAILAELVKNLELAKMSLRKEAPLIQVIDYPIFPLEKTVSSKLISMIIGAGIFGFLIVMYLTVKRIINAMLN